MASAGTPSILYFVHDLSDAAVEKRITMLKDGGARVRLAGFRRSEAPVATVAGSAALDLGRTYNGGFLQRIWSVVREIIHLKRHAGNFQGVDIIIARNLEMLAVAVRARRLCSPRPALVYESLDIHRLLLKDGPASYALRRLEGWLAKRASGLITSSPAFMREYFEKRSRVRLPVRLVENKVYNPMRSDTVLLRPRPGKPWIIGWFGIIRCRKSLHLLSELVRNSGGGVEVIIRGKPARDQLGNFDEIVSNTPGLRFLGPYKNPDDLAAIYGEVHFTWAIDMFEEGLNSKWLLPNRMYEGLAYGSVPIADEAVETSRHLRSFGVGLVLSELRAGPLAQFFGKLTGDYYQALQAQIKAVPSSAWTCSRQECADLVSWLVSLREGAARA